VIALSIRKRLGADFCLDLEFETGDGCLGILGASGAGKSMTLKCIAGIERPDEGHIEVNGRVLFDSKRRINLKPQARRVGYLFQNYALFPRMTVLGNIRAAKPAGGRLEQAEFAAMIGAALERFGLAGLENRRPRELSGGQQQRVALLRMLCAKPEALLFDEPFSALDMYLREQIEVDFPRLIGEGRNAVLVTHSRDEIFRLCPELLLLDMGKVAGRGPTKELFKNPLTVAAARLTGCKNISPLRVLGAREVEALDWGLRLRTACPVDGATHIGIRAHDLRPARGETFNLVAPRLITSTRTPFEETLIFSNADRAGSGQIWWKYSRYMPFRGLPEKLFLPPESLMLLI
jgi:molybdate transport system ATP-binding protein